MKKFTINCDFGGQIAPFSIYIGKPEKGHHPLHFQADWLSKNRGGTIPGEVMEAISQLQELAEKNNVSLEELCVYALGTQEEDGEEKSQNEDADSEIEEEGDDEDEDDEDNEDDEIDDSETDDEDEETPIEESEQKKEDNNDDYTTDTEDTKKI